MSGSKLMSNLEIVRACDSFPYNDDHSIRSLYKFYLPLDPRRPHGYMLESIVNKIPWSAVITFEVDHQNRTVTIIKPPSRSIEEDSDDKADASKEKMGIWISRQIQQLIDILIDQNLFQCLGGRHSELFIIPGTLRKEYGNEPVYIERFAVNLFGVVNRGAHCTVYRYVYPSPAASAATKGKKKEKGEMRIYVQRRSLHLHTYPGKLDSSFAGGVRGHETPRECLLHEAEEEASLPRDYVVENLKSTSIVSYMAYTSEGCAGEKGLILSDMISCFDMELPPVTIDSNGKLGQIRQVEEENENEEVGKAKLIDCKPRDDEVKEFYLWTVDEVRQSIARGEWKLNSAVIMMDFFVRHGIITKETESEGVDKNEDAYEEILGRMRRKLHFPVVRTSSSSSSSDWNGLP